MIKECYYRALTRFDKKQKEDRQTEEARLAEAARLAEEARMAKKRAERLLHHQAEKARLVKKRAEQQQAEQARVAREQKEARLTTFACRRCSAKFPSNTKLHNHVQDHHHKKSTKPESDTSISSPPSPITPSEIAIHPPPHQKRSPPRSQQPQKPHQLQSLHHLQHLLHRVSQH